LHRSGWSVRLRCMSRTWLGNLLCICVLCHSAASSQTLKPGVGAPPITATPTPSTPPFHGWGAYRGNYVIIDFWATWCGPCVAAMPRIAALKEEFKGRPVRFVTVALDEAPRVEDFLKRQHLSIKTYVDGPDGPTSKAYGVYGIPVSAVIDPKGNVVAVTSGDNITSESVRGLLAGSSPTLPALAQPVDPEWDKSQISWQDGVQPSFEAIIKPIQVRGSGIMHKPGSNRISGDGLPLTPMIWYAWQTDSFHIDIRIAVPNFLYRAVILVPKGRENSLFPSFQSALESTFGFHTRWEEQDRNVLVLRTDRSKALLPSASQEQFGYQKGHITFHKQTIAKLAEALPNWTRIPVLDETSLPNKYDFDLEYRDDRPDVLISELKEKYGLILERAKRKVHILVVEPELVQNTMIGR
jgi:uncharacterized protein (TIGR03435 family)